MAEKELVKLGWETSFQSSKKLNGNVVKLGDIGLDSRGRGHALGYAQVDIMQRFVVPPKCEEIARVIAEQKVLPIEVLLSCGMLLYDGI